MLTLVLDVAPTGLTGAKAHDTEAKHILEYFCIIAQEGKAQSYSKKTLVINILFRWKNPMIWTMLYLIGQSAPLYCNFNIHFKVGITWKATQHPDISPQDQPMSQIWTLEIHLMKKKESLKYFWSLNALHGITNLQGMIVSQEIVEVLGSISLFRARLSPTLYVVLTFHFLRLCFGTAVQMTHMNMEKWKGKKLFALLETSTLSSS